jgi:Zn-dependent hydrolases, including glyoxylases
MEGMSGTWIELTEGVFARRYAELDLTVGLVLGAERALVIDTRGDTHQGSEWAAAVRDRTSAPITVALTHAHFDHCFGTAAFGPVRVLAHPGCAAAIARSADDQRAEWVARYRDRGDDATADALAASVPVPPEPAPPRLDLGGRVVLLRHLGRGHTDHDLVVDVPDADVVFAGDLVEEGAPPDLAEADVAAWPATLTALLELGRSIVVPGHGAPVGPEFVAQQRDRLQEVADLCARVQAGTLSAEEAARRSPYPGVPWP